jgi:hypothetical protein
MRLLGEVRVGKSDPRNRKMRCRRFQLGMAICAMAWFALLTVGIPQVFARDVTLAWEPTDDPSVDGYLVYYREGDPGEPDELDTYEVITRVPIYDPADPNSLTDPNRPQFNVIGLNETKSYYFVVAAYDAENLRISKGSREIFILGPGGIPTEFGNEYDRCWGVSKGDLEGFAVLYSSVETAVPTFGSPQELPAFGLNGFHTVGLPLNLSVEPHQKQGFVFIVPVTLFIPVPDGYGSENLSVGLYESTWTLAWDGESGSQKGGWDWLDAPPLYRSVHSLDSLSGQVLELKVSHFSGIQLVRPAVDSGSPRGGEGGGGCFVSTLLGIKMTAKAGEEIHQPAKGNSFPDIGRRLPTSNAANYQRLNRTGEVVR